MENTFKQQAMIYRRKPLSLVLRGIVWACGIFTVGILLFLLGFILVNGLPYINLDFLTQEYNSENLSALSSIVATLEMIFFSLLFSVPCGGVQRRLPGGIRPAGEPSGQDGQIGGGDPGGHPFHYLRLVRHDSVCHHAGLADLHAGGHLHLVYHGAAGDHLLQ